MQLQTIPNSLHSNSNSSQSVLDNEARVLKIIGTTSEVASHAHVLRGSPRVPSPKGRVTIPCVGEGQPPRFQVAGYKHLVGLIFLLFPRKQPGVILSVAGEIPRPLVTALWEATSDGPFLYSCIYYYIEFNRSLKLDNVNLPDEECGSSCASRYIVP